MYFGILYYERIFLKKSRKDLALLLDYQKWDLTDADCKCLEYRIRGKVFSSMACIALVCVMLI